MDDYPYVNHVWAHFATINQFFTEADMKPQINAYLEGLAESEVRSLADVIDFNEKHSDQELPLRTISPVLYLKSDLLT